MSDRSRRALSWSVAAVLASGVGATSQVLDQKEQDLREPLAQAVSPRIEGLLARDLELNEEERRVAGVSSYVMRVYEPPAAETAAAADAGPSSAAGAASVSVYVGFYQSQTGRSTIHSPKNCLPGSGWEALTSQTIDVPLGDRQVQVNKYLLVNDGQSVLVLYWYQGRGRVVASEYAAKWDLLRDAALRRRSDEALVRVVVPVGAGPEGEAQALVLARSFAADLLPELDQALPAA